MDGTLSRRAVLGLAVATALTGCAPLRRPAGGGAPRRFVFPADVFAFANGVHWQFVDDPATGARVWTEQHPPPPFALRCSGMVRAVRQFLLHARFDPTGARSDDATSAALARRVLATDPRTFDASAPPIAIPGYADLRSFSRAHEAFLKDVLLHDWRSVLPDEDWRLLFATTPAGQGRTASSLAAALDAGRNPIVRVLRYPEMSLNHAILLVGVEPGDRECRFRGYDPNDADRLVTITWDGVGETFRFPATAYFAGGPVKVYGIYERRLV